MEQLSPDCCWKALRRCSLVCKDFAAICQKQLFSDIDLSNRFGYRPTCKKRYPALAGFKQALDSKPYLAGHVRDLSYSHDFDRHSQWPPVLRRLRHVESLFINLYSHKVLSWSSSRIPPSFKSSLLRFIQSNQITYLSLSHVHDLPTHIFALVPRLDVLKVREITLDNDPPLVQDNPPKLRTLHLHGSADQLVDTLVGSQNCIVDLRGLTHIDIYMCDEPAPMGVIRNLLQQSEAIYSLKIDGGSWTFIFRICIHEELTNIQEFLTCVTI